MTVTGNVTVSGAAAANYSVIQPTGLTADITVRGVTITGATADNKVYDATDAATLNLSAVVLGDVVPGDTVNIASYAAAFSDKNVGNGKTVSWTGINLGGADAGNYTPLTPADMTADITALDITGAFTADNKVYDGTPDAMVATRSLIGTITGDVVEPDGGTRQFRKPGRRYRQDRHPHRRHTRRRRRGQLQPDLVADTTADITA